VDGVVSALTRLQVGWLRNHSLISDRSKRFFSSSVCPDQLLSLHSILFSGYQELFPWSYSHLGGMTDHSPHVMRRLRMSGAIPPHISLYGLHSKNITLTFTFTEDLECCKWLALCCWYTKTLSAILKRLQKCRWCIRQKWSGKNVSCLYVAEEKPEWTEYHVVLMLGPIIPIILLF
jgi:hypothetical protein